MCSRVVYIIETNRDKEGNELEKVRSILRARTGFVTAVDEKNIIVVK